MKKFIKYIGLSAVAVIAGGGMSSCGMEQPFSDGNQGEGRLYLATAILDEVKTNTRADIDPTDLAKLREDAVVYIERKNTASGTHDVIRKYFGLDQVPSEISLAKGNTYLAEGWTGDSVSASFDAKFYRGKTDEFQVEDQTAVALKLNIANVLVAFAPETFDLSISNLQMNVSHSRGELTFSKDAEEGNTLENTGYFMMPSSDTSLKYTITGQTSGGEQITREGTIENVQRAHKYLVRLVKNDDPQLGAGLIKIEIEEIPVIEEEIMIFGRPTITGLEFDLAEQVVGTPGEFTERMVFVSGHTRLSQLVIGGDKAPDVIKNITNQDVTNNKTGQIEEFENLGIHVNHELKIDEKTGEQYDTYTLFFLKGFFDSLPESDEEYVIDIFAVDGSGKYNHASLRIANTPGAIEQQAPIVSGDAPSPVREPMAVLAKSATLKGNLYNAEAVKYGIQYRQQGTETWIEAPADGLAGVRRRSGRAVGGSSAGATEYTVTLKNLTPGTTYEYRAFADDFVEKTPKTFTTESFYEIPNASFENWSTYQASTLFGTKSVVFPGSGDRNSNPFWESGNEGAATANMTLTDKSTDMVHSGTYSARLASNSAMGVIAAGNVFAGSYVRTDGTNGVLSLGRPYNGSHPSKLKVWANYRPASGVTVKKGNEEFLPENFSGGLDHGQIYVALTTEPVEIRTNPSDRKLFNTADECVLAYGEKTWTGNFGADGQLEAVEIPITYNERARDRQALYLVIVVSASKYGDYFSGAKGSVFYLDDFELIY